VLLVRWGVTEVSASVARNTAILNFTTCSLGLALIETRVAEETRAPHLR